MSDEDMAVISIEDIFPFKIGQVVRLKSGGPNMTVCKIPQLKDRSVQCMWFTYSIAEDGSTCWDAGDPESSLFPPAALKLVEESEDGSNEGDYKGSGAVGVCGDGDLSKAAG